MVSVFRVLQALLDGVEVATQSYIKPGTYHRYSLDRDLTIYLRTVTAAMGRYFKAAELGPMVVKGEVGLPSLGLSNLIIQSVRDSLSKVGSNAPIHIHIPLITLTTSSTMVLSKGRGVNLSDLWRTYLQVLSGTSWRDSVTFVKEIKRLGTELSLAIDDLGITTSRIEIEGLTLHELLQYLCNKVKDLRYVIKDLEPVRSASNVIVNEYLRIGDLNIATVKAYITLLINEVPSGFRRSLSELLRKDLGREEAKYLISLDKKLRSSGTRYDHLLTPLITSTYAALTVLYTR
ncbi:MAG: hypothetical protein B6U85_08045 [Desulfurococcales archaeon ex4484_42]|nr:MAG: hypothetical protein B6U85_08045 [Desulfurococcales archaeon ex4484_42]